MDKGRFGRWLLIGLTLAVLVGCTTYSVVHRDQRERITSGPVAGTTYVTRASSMGEQENGCPAGDRPGRLVRFDTSLKIESVTLCPDGAPAATVNRSPSNSAAFEALADALAEPDDYSLTPVACTADYPIVGSFAVRVAGKTFQPAMPLDICGKPQAAALTALNNLAALAAG